MKICIPSENDHGLEGRACPHFGRSPFFTVVDPESGGIEVVPNPDCHAHPGACHHIRLLKAHDVSHVVCQGIGRRATAALADAGIEVLEPRAATVGEIVEKFRRGETRAAPADGRGARLGRGRPRRLRHGHGHGHRRGCREN